MKYRFPTDQSKYYLLTVLFRRNQTEKWNMWDKLGDKTLNVQANILIGFENITNSKF